MPFQEDLTEFLDIEQGFAVEAKITPINGGLPYTIRGIFTNDYFAIDAGAAGITGANPTFECVEDEAGETGQPELLNMVALAEHLGKTLSEIEKLTVDEWYYWLAYLKLKKQYQAKYRK